MSTHSTEVLTRGNKRVFHLILSKSSWTRTGEEMKRFVAFSIAVTLCLVFAGCARQPARNTQTVALLQATREGNTDMVRSLVSTQGADVNATDERGSTPLLEAARYGHGDITRLLIGAGADLKAKDKDGKTALMLAVQGDHEEVVRILNQAGATQ